jgi:hypothetical protein
MKEKSVRGRGRCWKRRRKKEMWKKMVNVTKKTCIERVLWIYDQLRHMAPKPKTSSTVY